MLAEKIIVVCFLVLAGVTVLTHHFVERYEQTGPEIELNNWEIYKPENNPSRIENRELTLVNDDPEKSVNFKHKIPLSSQTTGFQLSAQIFTENVVKGPMPWNQARLLFVQNDGIKDLWSSPHIVASKTDSNTWEHYSEIFIIQPKTESSNVFAQLSKCTGVLKLRGITIFPVAERAAYLTAKKIILGAWVVYAVLFFIILCFGKNAGLVLQAFTLISFLIIIIGTSIPVETRNDIINTTQDAIGKVDNAFEKTPKEVKEVSLTKNRFQKKLLSKIGHFIFFAMFGVILSLLLKEKKLLLCFLFILILAGGTELSQLYIDDRGARFMDFGIDVIGGFTGLLLPYLHYNRSRQPLI